MRIAGTPYLNWYPPRCYQHRGLLPSVSCAPSARWGLNTKRSRTNARLESPNSCTIIFFSSDDWCSPSSSVRKVRSLHLGLSGLRIGNLIRSAICLDLLSGILRTFLNFPRIAFINWANCVNLPKLLPYVSIIS